MNTFLRLLFLIATVCGGTGAAAKADGMARGAARNRPVAAVSLTAVLADAHRLAAPKGDKVVRVAGDSMLPYFGDGAVLVVRPGRIEGVREGSVVLYRNRFGETVAHRLEARSEAGWIVRGVNNREADSTLVTADNFLGTVYATFYSGNVSADTAPALGGVAAGEVELALAAPAR